MEQLTGNSSLFSYRCSQNNGRYEKRAGIPKTENISTLLIKTQVIGEVCFVRKPKIKSSKITHVGWSTCKISYEVTGNYLKGQESIKRGFYYICGRNAYFNLPLNWEDSCYLALLFLDVYYRKDISRSKRSASSDIWDIFGIIIPPIGVAMADKKIRRLTEVIRDLPIPQILLRW